RGSKVAGVSIRQTLSKNSVQDRRINDAFAGEQCETSWSGHPLVRSLCTGCVNAVVAVVACRGGSVLARNDNHDR
ncbi:hypothetical protein, partial [Nocardia arthritidis]|uniref:hypothetical protein n=1 Tax=Nocardia arthritidis TaxID=228602 RepID=UPI001C3F5400